MKGGQSKMFTGIERAPTVEERKDMQVVGERDHLNLFNREVALIAQKFAKKYLPFDEQCARSDFVDKLEDVERESERSYGYVRKEDLDKVSVDIESYGKIDRFEIVTEDEETEFQIIDGIKKSVKIGWTIKYRCKRRDHGISVFVPTDEYEERKGVKKEKKNNN